MAWTFDDDVDLDYHVRRSALPTPGRVRELLELTSRLHGTLLDRHRPLWEMHLIEGLNDGRFAIYTKMHHAIVDGVSALNLLQGSLSTDPDDHEVQAPWSVPPRAATRPAQRRGPLGKTHRHNAIGDEARLLDGHPGSRRTARAAADPAVPRPAHHAQRADRRRPPLRRQSWSLDRIKAVKNAAGVTVNDVVLAMCAAR